MSYDRVVGRFGEVIPGAVVVCSAAANRLKGKARGLSLEIDWVVPVRSTCVTLAAIFTLFIISTGRRSCGGLRMKRATLV